MNEIKRVFNMIWLTGDFKARRTPSDKSLRNKAFNIAKNPKYDGYQRGLSSMVYKFFDENSKGGSVNNEIKQNEQLVKNYTHQLLKKLKKKSLFFIQRQYLGC